MNVNPKPTVPALQRYILKAKDVLATMHERQSIGNSYYAVVDDAKYRSWRTQVLQYLLSTLSKSNHYYTGFSSDVRDGSCYPDMVKRGISLLENLIEDLNNNIFIEDVTAVEHSQLSNPTAKTNEVFIVHGHDELALMKVARFLERLQLVPIILHEQSSSGRTIIEKIEEYTNVAFGIVLYTQCDIGGNDTENLQPRARQNVVFEHGYLMGKIGRCNVCALVKGKVETPSDISGMVYTPMDNSDNWHIKLAKELRASGYEIDMNKL